MITKNELRIGNYLESDGREIIITGHYLSNMEKGMKADNPIPITEELLINFGFEKKNNKTSGILEFRLKNDIYRICFYKNGKYEFQVDCLDYYKVLTEITYFHELQNLYFSITKKELKFIKSEATI